MGETKKRKLIDSFEQKRNRHFLFVIGSIIGFSIQFLSMTSASANTLDQRKQALQTAEEQYQQTLTEVQELQIEKRTLQADIRRLEQEAAGDKQCKNSEPPCENESKLATARSQIEKKSIEIATKSDELKTKKATLETAKSDYEKQAKAEEKAKDVKANVETCENSLAVETQNGLSLAHCKTTRTWVDAAKIADQAGQMAGTMAVEAIGGSETAKAAQSGKLSDSYNAAAQTWRAKEIANNTMAAGSLTMGVVMLERLGEHNASIRDIDKTPVDPVKDPVNAAQLKAARVEQDKMASEAGAAAGLQAINATKYFIQAKVANDQKHQNRKNRDLAKEGEGLAESTWDGSKIEMPSFDQGPQAAAQSAALSGGGSDTKNAAVEDELPDSDTGGLGISQNTDAPLPGLAGMPSPPGEFNRGGSPGGGGGGSGGVSPGSTGAATPEKNTEGTTSLAERITNPNRYGGGGGGYGAAAGGAKGNANSGPDLSGMLAALLPKDEKDVGPEKNILDYGNDREPASEAPFSPLARDADIFKVVHDAYQDKHRRGAVGL